MYELQKLLNKVVTKRESSTHPYPATHNLSPAACTHPGPLPASPAMPHSLLLSSCPFSPSQSETSGPRASAWMCAAVWSTSWMYLLVQCSPAPHPYPHAWPPGDHRSGQSCPPSCWGLGSEVAKDASFSGCYHSDHTRSPGLMSPTQRTPLLPWPQDVLFTPSSGILDCHPLPRKMALASWGFWSSRSCGKKSRNGR